MMIFQSVLEIFMFLNLFKVDEYAPQNMQELQYISQICQQDLQLIRMAKKSKSTKSTKIRRTSSMERCVADAKDFLQERKVKRITKTKTMARTIEEGNRILNPKKAFKPKKIARRPRASKIPVRPARPSLPAVAAVPVAPAVVPASAGSAIIRTRSIDRSLQPSKVTIFKTSSKDNLPLPAFGFIDVCFCVDATGSMCSELAQVQSTIVAIIKKIENKVRTEGITLRFAVVTYRDHPPQQSTYVTLLKDFTDAHEAIDYVNKLNATGGGDEPQAVHDGLIDACQKLNWVEMPGTPMLRYIFHVADAPPHGKEFLTGESQEGCLCGKTTDQVAHEINLRQIHYRLIKVRNNTRVDEMEKILRKTVMDFDSAQVTAAQEMDIRISDMIIHEILPQA